MLLIIDTDPKGHYASIILMQGQNLDGADCFDHSENNDDFGSLDRFETLDEFGVPRDGYIRVFFIL